MHAKARLTPGRPSNSEILYSSLHLLDLFYSLTLIAYAAFSALVFSIYVVRKYFYAATARG